MPHVPKTWRFASVTHTLPGRRSCRRARSSRFRYASAAIACAPPARRVRRRRTAPQRTGPPGLSCRRLRAASRRRRARRRRSLQAPRSSRPRTAAPRCRPARTRRRDASGRTSRTANRPVGVLVPRVVRALPFVEGRDAIARQPSARGDLRRHEPSRAARARERRRAASMHEAPGHRSGACTRRGAIAPRSRTSRRRSRNAGPYVGRRVPPAGVQCPRARLSRSPASTIRITLSRTRGARRLRASRQEARDCESYLARKRTGLTTKRAVDVAISSTTTRSCSRSVLPVATRSTIRSASPTSGRVRPSRAA
jgi:hypothetical protein